MTLICYQLSTSKKWRAYERCSVDLPLDWSRKRKLIAVFELFAYLSCQLLEQEKVFQRLNEITNNEIRRLAEQVGINFILQRILIYNRPSN
jgi:hypothetical protein